MQLSKGLLHLPRILRAGVMAAACAAVAAPLCQAADAYPTKPITMIVPFPPGDPTDLVARVLAQKMSEQMGQQIIDLI